MVNQTKDAASAMLLAAPNRLFENDQEDAYSLLYCIKQEIKLMHNYLLTKVDSDVLERRQTWYGPLNEVDGHTQLSKHPGDSRHRYERTFLTLSTPSNLSQSSILFFYT